MMMFDPCSIPNYVSCQRDINHMNKCGIECDVVLKFVIFHAYDHTPENKQFKGGGNYFGSPFESTVPVAACSHLRGTGCREVGSGLLASSLLPAGVQFRPQLMVWLQGMSSFLS